MVTNNPAILALDFDGVICDGLIEYFQTSKRTYNEIWQDKPILGDDLAAIFYRLRPVIETGWEMPVLLRALVLKIAEDDILHNWLNIAENIITSEQLHKKAISDKLDQIRDRQIESDVESWLGLQRLYPGVAERLEQILDSDIHMYIVTTKEGRFVKKLLQEGGIKIADQYIYGKECQQPKHETLRKLLKIHDCQPKQLWFVEDRLKTLQSVQKQNDLEGLGLYLADWGYNTQSSRDSIKDDQFIHLISLEQFLQDFVFWQPN